MNVREAVSTFRGHRQPRLSIIRHRMWWFGLSGLFIVLSLLGLFVRGLNYSIDFNVTTMPGIRNALFGGDGLFLATLTGPGRVWLQSMSLPHLAHVLTGYLPHSNEGGLGGLLQGS